VGDLCVGSWHDSIKYLEHRAIAEKEECSLKGRADYNVCPGRTI